MRSADQTSGEVEEPGGLGPLLARGPFRTLLVGQTVSALGDWMGTVALMALVLHLTGSSSAVAVILVLRLAPAAVAGSLATRLVRRWDRRRSMMAMDLGRAGVVVLIPLVAAAWWVYLWALLLEVMGLVFVPARDSLVPDLVPRPSLPVANGLVLGSSYGTIPLGAGLFGAVSALAGTGGRAGAAAIVFWVDAATFLVSFAMVRRLRPDDGWATGDEHAEGSVRAAFRLPIVRRVAPMAAAAALGLGSLFSLGIVFVRDVLAASDTQFGVLVALFGVGAGLGLVVLRRWDLDEPGTLGLGLAVQGATIAGMSLAPTVQVAFVGAVVFGAATATTLAVAMSTLQDRLDDQDRVNAFTAFHVIIRAGLALAAVGAGLAADLVGPVHVPGLGTLAAARVVLLASGVLVLLTAAGTERRVAALDAS